MAILFGGSRVNDKTPPATSLRVQTALNGQPIAIVYGQQRLAGNLIWYGDFQSHGGTGSGKSGGGGKGGFVGGKGQSQATYTADVIIGLCEGPVAALGTVWAGQSIATTAKVGVTLFGGAPGQAPSGTMTAKFPNQALGYSSLAYAEGMPIELGSSPELPSLNFEVTSGIASAVTENYTITSPYTFTPSRFTLSSSVTEQVTIPVTGPYQIQAQNPKALTHVLIAGGGPIAGVNIPGSASQGVIDSNGRVFTRVSSGPATGQYVITQNTPGWVYTFAASDAGLAITIIDFAVGPFVAAGGTALEQVLGTPSAGQFSVSVQPGSFGQYLFAAADAGKIATISDVTDGDPSAILADFLTNPRYGCGFPTQNVGDLATLQDFAFAAGLFISPVVVSAQAANEFLGDFATGLNGEFVWSSGVLGFVPYGDTTVSGFGHTYTPPSAPLYALDDDDFLKNEGTASVGVSAFTSDDPVVCQRPRRSDAYNEVKIEYLDRGNSYNPAIATAQDDAAIAAYGLRSADTKQLHLFCADAPAMVAAQLQLGRQQVRNLYSFTVPWYFILLDPMDIIAISDTTLGINQRWIRIREITENQQDGSLTITGEEYLPGTAMPSAYPSQPRLGYVPNTDTPAGAVN